ncbi:hypothetical protein MDA_GLEAN10008205 [Myotis davidii]|uniref:Uncharacterized protein n=1 Tax=Myotis davidii TaxID=225400 RepID=L5LS39_MYODS|nr:hypothetical protein MDA_GLEAN10008205 [Myotis davidii]
MAELLPLLPGAPLLTQSRDQDSLVPPAEWQSQQPQDGRAEDLASEPWRLLEVPSIQITPSSDGESPHGTQALQHLQLLRTPDLESLPQDSSPADPTALWPFVFILSSERSACSGSVSQQQSNPPRQEPPPVVSAAPGSRQRLGYSCSHQCVFRVHYVPGPVLGAGGTVATRPS